MVVVFLSLGREKPMGGRGEKWIGSGYGLFRRSRHVNVISGGKGGFFWREENKKGGGPVGKNGKEEELFCFFP